MHPSIPNPMRTFIFTALTLLFAGITQVQAFTPVDTTKVYAEGAEDKLRTPVKLEDLTSEVKKTLYNASYYGWKAVSAVWVSSEISHYEIELTNGEEILLLKLDQDGAKM
jgi:hypothetical protein